VALASGTGGQAAYPRVREISRKVINRFPRGFTKTEARQLEDLLQRMLAKV